MAWVPIQESGIAFDFNSQEATFENSVVSLTNSNLASWGIGNLVAPGNFRVTVLDYQAFTEFGFTTQASFHWGTGNVQDNQTVDGTAFTPSPILMEVTQQDIDADAGVIQYDGATGSEWSISETYGYLVEVFVADPEPPSTCEEYGRTTRAYVSGYNRSMVHVARIRRQERRCVVANFNGAIPPGRSIVYVTWRCVQPWVTKMISAEVLPREVTVLVDFQNPGFGAIKATVELDNGEIQNQIFEFTVLDAPYFLEGTPVQGPYMLTASA